MTTPHKHADILRAIADGKRVQRKSRSANSKWLDATTREVLDSISMEWDEEFRIAPDTMTIGGREVERPCGKECDGHAVYIGSSVGETKWLYYPSVEAEEKAHAALTHIATHGDQIDKSALIERAVNKFLGWTVPGDFAPDGYISFDSVKANTYPNSWPIGTNLFTADQARRMFEYCLGDAP